MKTNRADGEKKLIQHRMAIQPDANWNISPAHRSTTPIWEATVDTLSSNSNVNATISTKLDWRTFLHHHEQDADTLHSSSGLFGHSRHTLGGILSLQETPPQ